MNVLLYKLISSQNKYHAIWKSNGYFVKLKIYLNKKKTRLLEREIVQQKKKYVKKKRIIFFLKTSIYIANFFLKKNVQKYIFYIKILTCKIKINFFKLSMYMFNLKIMLNSIFMEIRLSVVEILNTIQKKINLLENLLLFSKKKNNKIVFKFVLKILFLIKKNYSLNKNDFLTKFFFLYEKKKFVIYKFIQEIENFSKAILFDEVEKFILIYKQHLNYSRYFIESIKKINVVSFYPAFFLIVFELSRASNVFLLKIAKNFSKYCLCKIPLFLLFEIIEILLKYVKTNLVKLNYIKIFYFVFFKSNILFKKYKKNRNFLFCVFYFKSICVTKYGKRVIFLLNKLTFFCKKTVYKKILLCVFHNFFQKKNCFNNNFIRLSRVLIQNSEISKNKLFIFSFKIFFLMGKYINSNFLSEKINVSLKNLHRILELFIKKFYSSINEFILFKLAEKLKNELNYNKKNFQHQAAITIKIMLKKDKTKKNKNVSLENLVEIFYKKIVFLEFIYIFRSNISLKYSQALNFFVKKLLFEIKSKKIILTRALLRFVFCFLDKNFLFVIKKRQWVSICIELIKMSASSDFLVKKYCLCCIFRIKNIINYEKITEEIAFFYRDMKKKHSFSEFILFSLFIENFGCQAVLFFFFHVIKIDNSIKDFIELDMLMYIIWYLPVGVINHYSDLVCFILEKLCIQKKKLCSFYILLGLFSKKLGNVKYIPSLYFILVNIWPDIYQIKKLTFKCVIFSIQKVCFFVNNIQLKFIISAGIFHSITSVRKIYWYVYTTIKDKLKSVYIDIILPNVNKKFKSI